MEVGNDVCVLCQEEVESLQHLFFGCTFSRLVVQAVGNWLGNANFPLSHNRWRVWLGSHVYGSRYRFHVAVAASAACVYHLWIERNSRSHGKASRQACELVRQIKSEVGARVSLNRRQLKHSETEYLVQLLIT